MPEKTLGPRGQVVLPKAMRDALGLREGTHIVVERRGSDEIVIRKREGPDEFLERFLAVPGRKLDRPTDLKDAFDEELAERYGG